MRTSLVRRDSIRLDYPFDLLVPSRTDRIGLQVTARRFAIGPINSLWQQQQNQQAAAACYTFKRAADNMRDRFIKGAERLEAREQQYPQQPGAIRLLLISGLSRAAVGAADRSD